MSPNTFRQEFSPVLLKNEDNNSISFNISGSQNDEPLASKGFATSRESPPGPLQAQFSSDQQVSAELAIIAENTEIQRIKSKKRSKKKANNEEMAKTQMKSLK